MKKSLWPLVSELWQPRFRLRMILALLCLFLAKIGNVIAPLFYKQAIDALGITMQSSTMMVPLALILAYGFARISNMIFGELQLVFAGTALYRVIREVSVRVFSHLHSLSMRFHLERRTGGLSRLIERGISAIQDATDMMVWVFIPAFFELVLTLGMIAHQFGLKMTAVTAATIFVYVTFTIVISKWRMDIRRQAVEQNTKANAHAVDSLINYETVKYFNNEAHEAARYDKVQAAYEEISIKGRVSLALLNSGQSIIIAIGLMIVMYLAAHNIIAGQSSLGDFVLINTYLLQIYIPLNFLGSAYRTLTQSMVDMEKMFTLLEAEAEIKDAQDAKPLQLQGGEIRFENVSFGYDHRRPILCDVSFTVGRGKTVAVVGASGAGKSTLSRLLYRFYDVDAGRILIDGQDLRQITQDSLRRAIGIVPQDTVLFNETLAYNILYGCPDASETEMLSAAQQAHIDTFCQSLPDGYKTMVGERGLKLSGGEKQRVAIARTILKNPAILILDEATSALDSRTEKAIQANLEQVSRGRTTLVIAHRLSTIANADLILVMDAGVIKEQGTHAILLQQGGLYAEMWRRQQENKENQ